MAESVKSAARKVISRMLESDGKYSRADFDELIMILDHAPSEFPERMHSIAREFDRNFKMTGYSRQIQAERLHRVLDLHEKYPPPKKSIVEGSELLPTFKLQKKDKDRVLGLCAQMRKIVLSTEAFDQPHKRRLLNRIAGIENQVEQPKGLLDVVLAGVSDVGETLGKFGQDIKPLTDRMQEVSKIARANSEEYKQIPSPDEIKQLPAPDASGDEDA